jgi:hypothetical protein
LTAIVICTTDAKCLPVLAASITCYVPTYIPVYLSGSGMIFPRHQTINSENTAKNFGDAFNAVCNEAFKDHEDLVVCNDDIVFMPSTWQRLMEDVSFLQKNTEKVGWVAGRSDYSRGAQNIRNRFDNDKMVGLRWESEQHIVETDMIAPFFGWVSKEAWVDFPPLNWYSDDVQCIDMSNNGFKHYVSRAYVHHAGSQTLGMDYQKCVEDAKPWIEKNRPELAEIWFKKN